MAWNLEGTYLETCSCEFICPCYGSLAHGATSDRCRMTPVFNITTGEVEAETTRSRISAFGIEYEGRSALSSSHFSWAA